MPRPPPDKPFTMQPPMTWRDYAGLFAGAFVVSVLSGIAGALIARWSP